MKEQTQNLEQVSILICFIHRETKSQHTSTGICGRTKQHPDRLAKPSAHVLWDSCIFQGAIKQFVMNAEMLFERNRSLEFQGGFRATEIHWQSKLNCHQPPPCLSASRCQEQCSEVTSNRSPSQKEKKYHSYKAPLRGGTGRRHTHRIDTLMWNMKYIEKELCFAL